MIRKLLYSFLFLLKTKKEDSFTSLDVNISKKSILRLSLLLLVFISSSTTAFAQLGGNVISNNSGSWNASGTWTAVNINRTGNVTSSTGSTTVTGTGTLFLTELSVGSIITRQNGTTIGTVASIASNTSLTLTTNASNNVTGQSYRTVGGTPSPLDAVTIQSNHTVTVNGIFTCASLAIGNSNNIATLTFSGTTPQLTVTSSVVIGNNNNSNRRGVITFTNDSKLIAGNVTNGNNGNNGTINMTAGGILETGSFLTSTGTWTPGSGTVVMTATNTLPSSIFTSFNNLTCNSGTTTMGTGLTINGNLNIATTLATGNNSLVFGGNFTNNGTFTAGSSAITIAGTGTQNISGFTTTGAVSVTKTGGMATLTGTVSGGNFTIASGPYLNLGATAFTHTASTLTLGTTQVLPGSYGGTTSGATNISSSYFASALGIINATTSTCSSFTTVTPITSVTFNTLNKTTAATNTTAYQNYTADTPTVLSKTQYYDLTVKGNTGGDVNGYYTAFIDWNNDGDFDDSGESIVLGTIKNSSGTDSKVTSAYIQIPPGAITGNVKMRIIGRIGGYSSTPCVVSGSTGQMQDYTITIQDACTGSAAAGNTLASANPVCSDTTLTLSLQNQSSISRAATYLWETSTDGGNTWLSATPMPNNFFFSDFTTMPASTNIYGDAALSTAPSVLGRLVLVPNTGSKQGGFVIQKTPGKNINPFTVNFDYAIYGGNGADGFSLSYAGDLPNDAGGGESGQGSGIIVQFDTYDNEGVTGGGSRVRILYNGTQLFDTALDAPFNIRTSSTGSNINLNVDANGVLSLNIGGTVFIANLQLPAAYLSTDKSNWKFKFSGRTGGNYDEHSIDNLSIKYLDVLNTGSTFTTTQSVPTKYRVKVTCGGTTTTSADVTVNMISAVVSTMTASACSGVAFTVTPTNGTNGTIPSGTTYSWPAPVVTGGITGGAASTGTPASITGTISNTTGTAQTATYTVTPTTAGCAGVPFIVTVTVNTLPTPTFTTQPGAAACANTDVTYTTQAGMSNYVWGFPGVLGTDYTITSGGSNLSNTVTLKYITATNKTVTINYTNTNGCTATSATSSTATTISPSTVGGTVGGSATVCTGTNSTILTLTGHTGSIIRWESSLDNFATAGTPIVNTTTTLTATNLTATTSYRVVIQSGSCGALNSVAATVTVSPATVAGTVGGGTTVCTGTNSTVLTLSGHTGSVVRWESSLNNFSTAGTPIVNTTTTLTATNLTATTSYRAVVQSGSCGALNSVAATVTVSPATVSGTVGGGATVCTGTNSTVLTLSGHTGSVVRWESSLDNFATAGTPITNTTTTLTATNLTTTTSYRAVVQSGSCGALNSVAATVTVSPATVAGTVGTGTTVCTGTNSTALTLTGHTGSVVRWESSLNNFATAGTPIVNTTTTLTATNLTATTSYRAVVQSGSCGSLNSVAATVTVSPATVAGTVGGGATVCTGTNSTVLTLSGNTGSVVRWESSLDNFATAGTPITNTTTTLTATNLTATTSYRAVVQSGSCGALNSVAVTVTVSPATVAGTVGTSTAVCSGTNSTILTLSGHAGSIVRWESSLNNFATAGTPIANTTATLTATNLTATTSYRAVVQSGSCGSLNSVAATVTVSPATVAGTVSGGATVCTGTNSTVLTLSGNTGSVVRWESSLDNFATAGTPITNTTTTLTATNLTATTSYRAVVQSGSCGALNSVAVTVTVSPATVAGTVGTSTAVCSGTNSTILTLSGHAGSIVRWESSLNNFATAGTPIANTTATLTATNLTATTSYRAVVQNGTCGALNSVAATITVNPLPTTPSPGTKTPYTCAQAGSVVLSSLPAGAWTLTQTGTVNNVITGSGTTYTVTGLVGGNYNFTVSNGTCPSLSSSTVTINDLSTTTWNGSVWSDGIGPDATKTAIFAGAYTMTGDLEACSCTINSGVNLVVPTGRTLKITNALHVTTGGSLTFEDSSSLVQVNDASVNTGNITYKRISKQIRQADFTYWSTPVNPQTLYNVSTATQYNMYMGFTGDNWLVTDRNDNMMVGKGYIIRGPQTFSNTAKADYEASFYGVPNNGTLSGETLQAGKFYLIGNPYPSALKASAFLAGNLFMNGTLYFWTHNTPVVLGGAYQYTSSDYASYNLTGGVGTSASTGNTPGNNNNTPSGYIAAGQSFFASAATSGTIAFNNGMREGGANNGQFFKPAKTGKETSTDEHHIWLNFTNEGGAFKQMLVGYVDGATNSFDKNYDGETFDGNIYVDFYSINDQRKFVIQGRALPFADTDVVPLGYRSTVAGDFTIAIDQADGNLATQAVYIEDKSTGIIHDLKAGKFTFTTAAGTFTDRLVLRYTNKTLGTGDFENTENGILVSVKNKVIKVDSSKENIKEVTIYDVSGKLLYNKKKVGTTELQIVNLQAANQVLLVKVTLENNYTTNKKIIFQ